MIEELFVGGPLAGWRQVTASTVRYGTLQYPIRSRRPLIATIDKRFADEPHKVGTYARRRYWHPSWRVTLPFWLESGLDSNVPEGSVMPGWAVGEQLEWLPLRGQPWQRLPAEHWRLLQAAWNKATGDRCVCGHGAADHLNMDSDSLAQWCTSCRCAGHIARGGAG